MIQPRTTEPQITSSCPPPEEFPVRFPLILRFLLTGILLPNAEPTRAETPDPKGVAFFEQKVRPVLVKHCYQCHSVEAQKSNRLKADLFLDTKAGVLKGGEHGPALV